MPWSKWHVKDYLNAFNFLSLRLKCCPLRRCVLPAESEGLGRFTSSHNRDPPAGDWFLPGSVVSYSPVRTRPRTCQDPTSTESAYLPHFMPQNHLRNFAGQLPGISTLGTVAKLRCLPPAGRVPDDVNPPTWPAIHRGKRACQGPPRTRGRQTVLIDQLQP
jgi:hypothetical protein